MSIIKENISVDTLASSINISPSYVFKTLRDMKNESFTEYVAKKRVEEACELLKTDMKIQDIAEPYRLFKCELFHTGI